MVVIICSVVLCSLLSISGSVLGILMCSSIWDLVMFIVWVVLIISGLILVMLVYVLVSKDGIFNSISVISGGFNFSLNSSIFSSRIFNVGKVCKLLIVFIISSVL